MTRRPVPRGLALATLLALLLGGAACASRGAPRPPRLPDPPAHPVRSGTGFTATVQRGATARYVFGPDSAAVAASVAYLRRAPETRAERTGYAETSRHADVVAFLDSLAVMGVPFHFDTLGRSGEGRAIPLVVASRPRVRTPDEARRLGRPVVWLQANIHAGEVEGKEAVQALLRDLAAPGARNVLDSLVVLAVPIYNVDGNERVGPQRRQRSEQQGPELVGQRPNAAGLDLNRDYVKAEAPETRAALRALNAWDPDVFVDLHTTNGSYHGYALTWSPSLHPSAGLRAFNQDTLLPLVARRLAEQGAVRTFPYGNFSLAYGEDVGPDGRKTGWYTYDHRARFGTNYYGLRGRLSVLGEAYSHDPFRDRVFATRAFVDVLLSTVAEAAVDIQARARRFRAVGDTALAVRARLTTRPDTQEVLAERLVRVDTTGGRDTVGAEPGVPRGLRRTGQFDRLRLPVFDRFEATQVATVPRGGWAFDATAPGAEAAARLLRTHGVQVRRLTAARAVEGEVFRPDSVLTAARAFQGHREVRVEGRWRTERRSLAAMAYVVPADQPLALLALALLAPESDDGLVTWNVWDAALGVGRDFPVVRLRVALPAGSSEAVP